MCGVERFGDLDPIFSYLMHPPHLPGYNLAPCFSTCWCHGSHLAPYSLLLFIFLNFDLRVQYLLICKVTKWAICLKHFWYKLKDNGCLKEKHLCDY